MTDLARSYRFKPRTVKLIDTLSGHLVPGVRLSNTQVIELLVEAKALELNVVDPEVPSSRPKRKAGKK